MLTMEKSETLHGRRFNAAWQRTSPYLPLQPALSRKPKGWWQRLQRMVWKFTHRR